MRQIIINGKGYQFNGTGNVSIINGVVTVDGQTITTEASGVIEIKLDGGYLGELTTDAAVTINGHVEGNVRAGGSVQCHTVKGDVMAGGSVSCGQVQGDVSAGGSINMQR